MYYRFSKLVLLVYDVSSRKSFDNLFMWINQIEKEAYHSQVILIANKIDLDREVTTEEGEDLAREYGFYFIETSATEGTNTNRIFDFVSEKF
mmetsp:Transcript_6667/g.7436  ORF Transcript_6667/g.7436 Transcript_6667/m.7436 type:complete len:92 (+) Transcript_6667:186-461(+)